jgi:hypothetical protein
MNNKEQAFAVATPLPGPLISRVIEKGRTVVAKFLSRPTKNTRLGPGTIMLFYQSGEPKSIVGEAFIKRVEFENRKQILQHHGRRLFLDENELEAYANKFPGRDGKLLMVFDLESPKRYEKALRWPFSMTMKGRQMTEEEYRELHRKV